MLTKVLRVIVNMGLVLAALAALGALVPTIPVIGSIGPLLVSPFGSWIVLLSLLAAIVRVRRWRRGRGRGALVMAVIAGFAAIGTTADEAQQIGVARANGVSISLLRTLWLGPVSHSSAPPVLERYGEIGGAPLQVAVYRPASQARAPVLIYVHGGGWGAGTVYDRQPDMRWFADRGFLVVSVQYSLSDKTHHAWNVAEPEIGCALAWVGANAGRFGGDASRVALFGESAGGNLVVNVAYKAAAGKLKPACPGALPRIAAVVAPYPVLDATRMYHNRDLIAGRFAPTMTVNYTGGTPDQFPDRYAAISSPGAIDRAAPPTLLFPGLADHLLPPAAAFDFARRAQSAGVDVRVIAVPGAEHSFDQMSGSVGSQLVRNATLQFLAQHGLAPRP